MRTATVAAPPRARARTSSPIRRIVRAVALLALLAAIGAIVVPVHPTLEQYLAAAASARASLRYDRALAFYSAAQSASPRDLRPPCLAAEVRLLQQDAPGAATDYRRCLNLAPTSAPAWLGLGDALAATGDAPHAEDAWRRAVAAGNQTAR